MTQQTKLAIFKLQTADADQASNIVDRKSNLGQLDPGTKFISHHLPLEFQLKFMNLEEKY